MLLWEYFFIKKPVSVGVCTKNEDIKNQRLTYYVVIYAVDFLRLICVDIAGQDL